MPATRDPFTGCVNDHGGVYGWWLTAYPVGRQGGSGCSVSLRRDSDEVLSISEAHDEIAAGLPTVVHGIPRRAVHRICLMG